MSRAKAERLSTGDRVRVTDYVEPTLEEDTSPIGGTIERHPAYGMIAVGRPSGTPMSLYGSDFMHHRWIEITISHSELGRNLSEDRPSSRSGSEIIRIAMSEMQWAEFVASIGVGGGVQVTLQHIEKERVPQIPRPVDRIDQFAGEARAYMADGMKALDELETMIAESGLSGVKRTALMRKLEHARAAVSGNLNFVGHQFGEHMERVVASARTEIASALQHTLQSRGLDALAGPAPLSLPEPVHDLAVGDLVVVKRTRDAAKVTSVVSGGYEVRLETNGQFMAYTRDELDPLDRRSASGRALGPEGRRQENVR